jgi:hypothetical protein
MGRFCRSRRRLSLESLESRIVLNFSPIISEFLASNSDGLRDSDGDSSDWIEIYNPTSASVNLQGWRLTDDPGDLNQWTFPSTVIAPDDFLVVFASGKNRATSGSQLHTNFRLSSDADFLALINPSGVATSQFNPYPKQATNVSYGVRFESTPYLSNGSNARSRIPANGNLGATWIDVGFNDTTWASTPIGIGFGVQEAGFDITYVKANTEVDDIAEAIAILNDPSRQSFQVSERVPWVNYMGNGGGGRYESDRPFPTQSIGDDINDFIVRATSVITIPSAGNWTFGVNSDDGFRLRLRRAGAEYMFEYPSPRPPFDTLQSFNLPAAGEYELEMVMFERAGGASVEMFAAQGTFSDWNATDFDLIGDIGKGGLASGVSVPPGPNSPYRSDIGSSMRGINASAYVRIPFQAQDTASLDSLRMQIRYDDGFVAYLNGIEVARRNAPNTLQFNSSATRDMTSAESGVTERILVSDYLSALRNGDNVLAIQGLNSSASDSSFLLSPALLGSRWFEGEYRVFEQPTPGQENSIPSLGIISRVSASQASGFYNAPVQVTLQTDSTGAQIRFTLNGSTPTATNGQLYTTPITVASTTTLRAIAYRDDYVSLPTITRTYLYLEDVIRQSANGSPPTGWPTSWGGNVVDYGMDPDILNLEGAQQLKEALTAIPSLSITTDLPNLFDPGTGIYANPYNDGRDWERPASLELIQPDSTAGFQVNSGLRIRGGYSRSTDNPKHSFRLFFRGEYGDSTLEYPMFGNDSPMRSFKKLDLRTAQNYSWSFGGDPSNNFVAEYFSRLSQMAMGQPSTRSGWYHLYLNGQYWGLYQTQERAEAEFAASYFGGIASNYDVIKPEAGPYAIYATDGNLNAWYRFWNIVRSNIPNTSTPLVASNDVYLMLQGRNPDRTENFSYENFLDVDNLIVYMINILYGGNLDAPISAFLGNQRVNNFFAVRDRTGRTGFKYFLHDSEHTLRDVNENRNGPWPAGDLFEYSNPQWIHQRLMANTEYRMRFADLVQRYMFYDGALSVGENQTRFTSETAKLDKAIRAESARWGDAKRPNSPLTRADWLAAVTAVVGGYLPVRGGNVISQFRNTTLDGSSPAKLFPTIDAPTFIVNGENLHGGAIPPNSTLRFGATGGLVYYTLDGSDPRLFGGGIHPAALVFDPQSITETVVAANSSWKYRDTGADLGSSWRANEFDDSAWSAGNAELGYGDGDEITTVSFGPNPSNKYITTYFRKSFNLPDASSLTGARLRLKRDDGAVVYLNGVEATRSNMPLGVITASTLAASAVGGPDESRFFEFEINPGRLRSGNNVIAIEIHQNAPNSSDISFDAELIITRQSSASIPLGFTPLQFNARTLSSSGQWSALEQATFSTPLVPASSANLRVTELHYNPLPYSGSGASNPPYNDKDNFEFLELRNISKNVVTLDGVTTTGVTYLFPASTSGPGTWLLSGQSLVIVKNRLAFAARYLYPGSPFANSKIASGDYGTTNLNNGGETVAIFAANGNLIQSFTYDDQGQWPLAPDGGGPSLTILRTDTNLYDNATNWRASFVQHGTPGIEENDAPIAIGLSKTSVLENAPGALVGVLSTDDYDDLDTFTYSIPSEFANGIFTVIGNELRVGTAGLDFETNPTHVLAIKSTDAAGATLQRTFTITVIDVNEAPVLTRTQASVSGNVLSTFNNSGTWSDPESNPVTLSASLGTVSKNADGTWAWSFVPSQAYTNQTVTITGTDSLGLASQVQFSLDAIVAVVNSKVFYKGSTFAGTSVDAALDTSKILAKSGGTAQALTFANLINTTRGLNGLVFDVAGLATSSLTASDFTFRTSPTGAFNEATNPPSSWVAAPTPTSIHLTAGTATEPARVRLEWADNAIANRWLQVKVLANANTGLTSPQVYYIGHLYGEVNGAISGGVFSVSIGDATAIRPNVGFAAPVTSPFDLDKSGSVSIGDITGMRPRVGLATLRAITIPTAGSEEEGEGGTGGIPSSTPVVVLPKIELASDRAISQPSEIRSRLTDEVFDVPLPANWMQGVADATPWQPIRSANDLMTDSASPQDMLSLDEYFRRFTNQPAFADVLFASFSSNLNKRRRSF